MLSRIDRKDGEDVKVGEVLGVIDDESGREAPGCRRSRLSGGKVDADAGRTSSGAVDGKDAALDADGAQGRRESTKSICAAFRAAATPGA